MYVQKGKGSQRITSQKNMKKELHEQLYHMCGSPDHFIMFYPLWNVEHKKILRKKKKPKKI